MIYRKTTREGVLKALEDRKLIRSQDHADAIVYDESSECYIVALQGMTLFIDSFEINDKIANMINMFSSITVMGKRFPVMVGALNCDLWLIEEGEE